jgi:hypothetical protein
VCVMLCISCGAEMRIARIEQDAPMKAAGYEHRKLECVRCGKTERRLAFSGDRASWPVEYRWALASLSGAKPTCVGNDQKKGRHYSERRSDAGTGQLRLEPARTLGTVVRKGRALT